MGDSANHHASAGPSSERATGPDDAPAPPPDAWHGTGRKALLRLAAWFDAADDTTAHLLFTAGFGLYPARRLGTTSEDSVPATTSWWRAPAVNAVAPRGSGNTALPTAPASDHGDQQARLRDRAEADAHWRRAAAQELQEALEEPTPTDGQTCLHMSAAALDVLMELLTAALGIGDPTIAPRSAGDLELGIRLHVSAAPQAEIALNGVQGELVLEGLCLHATPVGSDHAPDGAGPEHARQPSANH